MAASILIGAVQWSNRVAARFPKPFVSIYQLTDKKNYSSKLDGIEVKLLDASRHDEAADVMLESFFTEEPLRLSLNANVGKTDKSAKNVKSFVKAFMKDSGPSYMALDENTQKMVGVLVNKPMDRERENVAMRIVDEYLDPVTRRPRDMLNELFKKEMDIYEKYNVDKYLLFWIGTVIPEYRGRGIIHTLLKRSLDHAKELGFKVIKNEATSYYTQQASEKCGFEMVARHNYNEIIFQGKPLQVDPPHTCLKIYIKTL